MMAMTESEKISGAKYARPTGTSAREATEAVAAHLQENRARITDTCRRVPDIAFGQPGCAPGHIAYSTANEGEERKPRTGLHEQRPRRYAAASDMS